jgi:hypothetical protein
VRRPLLGEAHASKVDFQRQSNINQGHRRNRRPDDIAAQTSTAKGNAEPGTLADKVPALACEQNYETRGAKMNTGWWPSIEKDKTLELGTLQMLANGNEYWQNRLQAFLAQNPQISGAAVHRIPLERHELPSDDIDAFLALVSVIKYEPTEEERFDAMLYL